MVLSGKGSPVNHSVMVRGGLSQSFQNLVLFLTLDELEAWSRERMEVTNEGQKTAVGRDSAPSAIW